MSTIHHLVLASGSPRRRELLALLGLPFKVTAANVDEQRWADEAPGALVLRLARAKACAGAPVDEAIIIAADTIVALDDNVLGKPADANEAGRMLRALRGRVHQVYTGVAVVNQASRLTIDTMAVTDVPMRCFSNAELEAYVASGDPLDKAGAYAIQHAGFHPVENLQGCFANVMGLPICHLARALRKMAVAVSVNVPQVCQAYLAYQCPVYQDIL
jgi:MAF protein